MAHSDGRPVDLELDFFMKPEDALRGSEHFYNVTWTGPCGHCSGTGAVGGRNCQDCSGNGYSETVHSYKIKVPSGTHEGQRLRLHGQGYASASDGKEAGDLHLRVRFYGSDKVFEKLPDARTVGGGRDVALPQVKPTKSSDSTGVLRSGPRR